MFSSNSTLLNVIAAGHAMGHAARKEAWTCECLACKFTKEFKIHIKKNDGTIAEVTMADTLLETMKEEGYDTRIPEPAGT